MITISISVSYPQDCGLEPYTVTFQLWEGYGCLDPVEAIKVVLTLLVGPQPAKVMDGNGETWEFYSETVCCVEAWE